MADKELFFDMMKQVEQALASSEVIVFDCKNLDGRDVGLQEGGHTNEHTMLTYIQRGSVRIELDGRREEVHPNEIVLVPKGMRHSGKLLSEGEFSAICVQFQISRFEIPHFVHVRDGNLRLQWIFEALRGEFAGDHRSALLQHYLLGTALLSMIKEHFAKKTEASTFERALAYIRANMNEKLTVNDIANEMYISPSYLCRLFARKVGTTVMKYLCALRIDKAKQYLRETNYTIEEIASKTGFSSSKYFAKKFKELIGVTPTAFRNQKLVNGW